MVTTQNLTLVRGDDKLYRLTFKDSNNTALDITGYTLFMTIKPSATDDLSDTSAVVAKTVTSHLDPTAGVSTINLSNTDTNELLGTYLYDIQLKDTDAKITTLLKGSYTVSADITRRIVG